jgi:hypothetical protein
MTSLPCADHGSRKRYAFRYKVLPGQEGVQPVPVFHQLCLARKSPYCPIFALVFVNTKSHPKQKNQGYLITLIGVHGESRRQPSTLLTR